MFELYSIGDIPHDRCWYPRSNGKTWEPVLAVELSNAGFTSKRLRGVVDSGSEVTLFQGHIGDQIGLSVRSGPSYVIRVAAPGSAPVAYFHEVQLKLPSGSVRILAGFCYELSVPALLGRHGFFEHFRVTFDPSRMGMQIEPSNAITLRVGKRKARLRARQARILPSILGNMAQLNLYVPDELAARLRAEARQANLPLSRYVAGLRTKRSHDTWPERYFEDVCGSWAGEAPIIEDLPAEPLNYLDEPRNSSKS